VLCPDLLGKGLSHCLVLLGRFASFNTVQSSLRVTQAIEFPLSSFLYFPPTVVGDSRRITVPLVNHSQYHIVFTLAPFGVPESRSFASFASDLSSDVGRYLVLSLVPHYH
jgi:hypothetical protein